MSIFTILLLRVIAFVLVTYFSVNLEIAVMLTSDPELVSGVNVMVSAAVVMLGEVIGSKFGPGVKSVVMAVLAKFATRAAEKVVLKKPLK